MEELEKEPRFALAYACFSALQLAAENEYELADFAAGLRLRERFS